MAQNSSPVFHIFQNLRRVRSRAKPNEGSALVEAGLVIPLLLLIMLNVVNFGIYIFAWVTVADAARAAVEFKTYSGITVQFPAQASFTQVQNLVNQACSKLPHYAAGTNPTLTLCSNYNGTITGTGCGSITVPADPNALYSSALYTLYSADVAYTFTPAFSSFTLPFLGISLTIPPTTIRQQAAMRSLQ